MAYKEGGLVEPLILGEGAKGLTKPEASGGRLVERSNTREGAKKRKRRAKNGSKTSKKRKKCKSIGGAVVGYVLDNQAKGRC